MTTRTNNEVLDRELLRGDLNAVAVDAAHREIDRLRAENKALRDALARHVIQPDRLRSMDDLTPISYKCRICLQGAETGADIEHSDECLLRREVSDDD